MSNSHFTEQAFIKQITAVVEEHLSDEQFGVSELAREIEAATVDLHRTNRELARANYHIHTEAVRQFLDRHIANESDALIGQAAQLLDDGDVEGARGILDGLPAADADRPGAASLRNRLYFAEQVADAPDADELAAKLESDPADATALHQLALRKIVGQDYDDAVDLLLRLMRADREYGDNAARRDLLKVFDLLGDDPRVGQYRRRMANLLH